MTETHETATPPRTVTVQIVNAFIRDGAGGNPAGVVLDADDLGEAEMQAIATSAGLSETAFVSQSQTETFKLDFFTPNRRIAHCGHATIGTFSVLAALGRVQEGWSSKETVDGPRAIRITEGAAFMEQTAPRYSDEADWSQAGVTRADVLDALGLDEGDLTGSTPPSVVDTGVRFLLVGLRDVATLRDLQPDMAGIDRISERLDLIGVYVFVPLEGEADATTRMFAPRYGIAEEAATGMAAGPLGCLLHDRFGYAKDRLLIEQGALMIPPSASLLDIRLTRPDGEITGLMVGGHGHVKDERVVRY
ncbi:MAG: PhzF family phenazine biosynthesis protein [Roseovarius sp.]|jgi:PhzF family phenazine biosynthesis protein|uniref:PhzF family phenazine biosynthesis protein n=1 Tax=Roseovarius sp. TaxID=1486281 RepID=UPI0032ED35F1